MQEFGSPDTLARIGAECAHADSVELKTLLLPPAGRAAEALTGRGAPTWSVRQVYLLDTAELGLVRAGVEIRLRRRARGRFDLAVSAHHNGISRDRIPRRGVRVEIDVVPGGMWQDVEVRREIDSAAAAEVIAGVVKSGEVLSPTQRAWACRGGEEVLDDAMLWDLHVHGPLVVRRVKVSAPALGLRRADLEHFRFPSGRELVEISTRCSPREVGPTATAFEQLLDERGVAIAPGYRTKTAMWREEIDGGS
ncbi:hypothetical protein LQ327_16285 [Actinomycetospora endophytica]|uniref:CYTH domain-containing protein n=1 Tax=Actinomycetospora endophytica TaxID=2291215 RepID=A0ABS8PAH6_9PSEU|nr:hypothetical protein [Actinomycetospora endophytica]MCD2194932.1 hypothetical protein [Actinomycetospora endophytica]